uniref:Reverse transcriptase domain-containing protein n=1 Tax=Cannabis sativa TaxID=3483 RepID=A0A803NUW7_CANSA
MGKRTFRHRDPKCYWVVKCTGLKRARLDRALASIDWRLLYPSAITHVLSAATLDHRLILLDTKGGVNCSKSQFKFSNTYIDKKSADLPSLNCLEECSISTLDNEHLKAFPTELEIERCIRSMGQERASGPDGMSTGFYMQHWATVKRDVLDMVNHFFSSTELPQCINNTNIVLIPKKECPSGVNDYRPIALCNVAYNCISKVLAVRLRNILPCIISPAQTAFVKGRLIAENTVVAKEIVHSMGKKRGENGYMMIKLDMEKAYDKMRWKFIGEVLGSLKFDKRYISWVKKCIEVKRMGLLLNDTVQGVISPMCGLRQGDPLSPALFIIAADVLSQLIMAKNEAGKIAGFKFKRGGPAITHFMFADDIILFGKASVKEAKSYLNCFEDYCVWSGQAVNYQKSTVHFTQGFPNKKADEIMNILGMKRMNKDSMYLGLPLFRGATTTTQADTKWKMIWKSAIHPHMKLIWWQLERDAFPTRDLVDVNGWEQWKDWFMVDINKPPNLTFLEIIVTAFCVVETVWHERNSIVHSQSRSPISKVVFTVNSKIRDHIKVASNDVVDFYGVVLATVVRDDKGHIVTIKTERSSTTDPLIGEGLAVCMAAELIIEMRAKYVIFQSDNMEVARDLSTESGIDIHFKLIHLRRCFHQLCTQLSSWGIRHVNRRCNYMAHNVAKWAKETKVIGFTKRGDMDPNVLNDYIEWMKHAG